jgi:predicted glutamine amidotransferase
VCRLFGFRSVIPSGVHRSLLAAENALGVQSQAHPDGWGVAYYVDGVPHLTRSPLTAVGDTLFHRLSGVVSSETVVAHVRKATQGPKTIINCHPFQYGRWVFAHNGDIPAFERVRPALIAEVAPSLRRFILGDTDSEVVFFLFLTQLQEQGALSKHHDAKGVLHALNQTLALVRRLGDGPSVAEAPCLLTVLVTDGDTLVATQGGRELYFSTHKHRCPDRGDCASLSQECEAPTASGHVNHLILSSEPLQGDNVWQALEPGEVVGVDGNMHILRGRLNHRPLAMLG